MWFFDKSKRVFRFIEIQKNVQHFFTERFSFKILSLSARVNTQFCILSKKHGKTKLPTR